MARSSDDPVPEPDFAAIGRALATSPQDFVVVADRDGVDRWLNRVAGGLELADLLGKATIFDHVPQEQHPGVRAALEQASGGVATWYTTHVPFVNLTYETTALPISGSDGAVLLLARDVSGRVQLEEQLTDLVERREDEIQQRTAELREANLVLERLARQDDLTALTNRRHLRTRLEQEIARSRRYGAPLSALVLDLDRFKNVNDTYGHHVGDAVLVETAHRIRGVLRTVDVAGRLGGDEFCVVLPQTDSEGAMIVGRRLAGVIGIEHPGMRPEDAPSLSVGVATLLDDEPGDRLLQRADRALYEAKRSGGGSVELASEVTVSGPAPIDPC